LRPVAGPDHLSPFIGFHGDQLSEVGERAGSTTPPKVGEIADLMRHSTQKKYEYWHKWHHGDWVQWDNRSVMANPDYDTNQHRYLYRRCSRANTVVSVSEITPPSPLQT
jgi:alpha-ketoglutarate-dependent taurine dioxygenase